MKLPVVAFVAEVATSATKAGSYGVFGEREYRGSSPSRVGDFGLISYRLEQPGENVEALVRLVA